MNKQGSLIAVVLALLLLLLGLAFFWQPVPAPLGHTERALPGGDFTVDSAQGPVSLHDYAGKLTVLYFGYTYCPDICPTSLNATAEAMQQLTPAELAQLGVLFVSVDPQRDTPARLAEYVRFFHPQMVGATASPATIAEIASRYGVFYARQDVATAGDGYVVDHSAETFLLGRDGRVLERWPHGTSPAAIVDRLRHAF
ncbi:MAG: SCO family protein [Dechloromonas sp.]|nr:SCO family protein [Dechloromonas sp.]